VANGRKLPFTNSVIVDQAEALEWSTSCGWTIPEEIKVRAPLTNEVERLLEQAREEAEQILARAQEQATITSSRKRELLARTEELSHEIVARLSLRATRSGRGAGRLRIRGSLWVSEAQVIAHPQRPSRAA